MNRIITEEQIDRVITALLKTEMNLQEGLKLLKELQTLPKQTNN